jgi:hypothetical protein
MIATATATAAITPARFARIVAALVASYGPASHGREWSSMLDADHDLVVRVSPAGRFALTVHRLDERGDFGRALRTATVQIGYDRPYEVVTLDRLVLGETRGLDAAMSIALDYVTAPLRAAAQHDHDPCAV